MTTRTGLIYAVDQSYYSMQTRAFLKTIAPYVDCYKFGLEAWTAIDRSTGRSVAVEVLDLCDTIGKPVFADIKLLDVKNTVSRAILNLVRYASMFTVHAQARDETLEAVANIAAKYSVLPLAVTVLTDLDSEACATRFDRTPEVAVKDFARNAYKHGLRGFVCSPLEIGVIRGIAPHDRLTVVTPSVRPLWYTADDEQQRVATPAEAARAGADYVAVGRPIGSLEDARRVREELDAR